MSTALQATTTPDLAELLTRKGVRPTRQRLEILGELAHEQDDVTAQALWSRLRQRKGSSVGLATVYRTLALLHDRGVIDSLSHHGTEHCYRLCTDTHHHHLLCSSCHRVVEVDECGLGDWLADVSKRHGFVATDHRVEIVGLCAGCRGETIAAA
ncbi:MAG TPA: transcriptional repressor [Gaiellaceae bacterium]|nr:transcriptional repressor [Gaiellaceae bacterium]